MTDTKPTAAVSSLLKPATADAAKPQAPAAAARPADHYEGKVEYPKWVHGELARDVDEEHAISAQHAAQSKK